MIPYASSSGSGKAPTLAAARVTTGGKHIFPPGMSGIGFPALHAMQTGGVYRVYAYSSGWASALVTMATSTDRQTWSPLSLDYQATALSVSLAKMRGLGVYADTACWAIVYVDDTGKRRLATEVQ